MFVRPEEGGREPLGPGFAVVGGALDVGGWVGCGARGEGGGSKANDGVVGVFAGGWGKGRGWRDEDRTNRFLEGLAASLQV